MSANPPNSHPPPHGTVTYDDTGEPPHEASWALPFSAGASHT